MITWKRAFHEGLVAGSLASVLSTAYLFRAGRRHGVPAAPVNAVSHWVFGDRALREDRWSARYTLTGALIHHGASVFWGVLHARAWGCRDEAKRVLPAATGALVAAGLACCVDYRLTPGRLTPGFEHRLTTREMVDEYAWVAVGLALGSLLMRQTRQPEHRRRDGNAASAEGKKP